MRELSKVEMEDVSGAGFISNVIGSVVSDISHVGDVIVGSISNGFVSTAKVFTDFVFNVVRGFNEGRYL